MNKNKKLVLVLFAISFLVIPMGIAASLPTGMATEPTNRSIPAAEYDFLNRRSPINILMYTEDTDTATGGEFQNVYESILETYGPAFEYENLTDYTQLAPRVFDFDVFLILEQEIDSENFTTIGQSWAGVLTDYVSQGGIVIQLDGGYAVADGGGKILNGTGLIKTSEPEFISYDTVNIVDATDPLAFGTAPYTAPSASWAVVVTNADSIFEEAVTSKTVVAHRQLGQGHVVLIGCDYFARNPVLDVILANAIRLTRLAVFDTTHQQQASPITIGSNFADALTTQGFAIATMSIWDEALIQRCDVFIVGNTGSAPDQYNTTEINLLDDFVAAGGGLLLMTDFSDYGNNTDPLLNRFGYARNYSTNLFSDSDDNDGNPNQPTFNLDNIANHSTTIAVNSIQLFGPTIFETIPEDATPIIWSDSDGTGTVGGDIKSGLALAAVSHHGNGRVLAIADGDWAIDTYWGTHDDFDFAINLVVWLSASGIPEKTILFEQTHSPFWSAGSLKEFVRMLTFNGFNTRWESQFHEQLIDEADVLIIINGSQNYTAQEIDVIQNYVAHGGGLFSLCDWGSYYKATNEIIAPFGMVLNGSSFLTDSDDGWVDAPPSSYIAYFGNNIGNHPIMIGVERIEIDRGCGFSTIGSGTALVITDNDGTAGWYNLTVVNGVANSVPVIAAKEFNMGRVVVLPDINFPGLSDPDNDNLPTLYDSDNAILLANSFYWLTENRAPSVEVITPNGGEVLNGTITVEWNAVDFDSDPLTFNVLYSDDNGSSWSVLYSGLTGLSHSWNTSEYADGNSYMVRVVVSDGVATTFDDSDAPFSIDNIAETTTGTGLPLNPALLAIIGVVIVAVIIILVVVMKKNKK